MSGGYMHAQCRARVQALGGKLVRTHAQQHLDVFTTLAAHLSLVKR